MEFALDLAQATASDPRITALLRPRRVFVVPGHQPRRLRRLARHRRRPRPRGADPLQRKNCRPTRDEAERAVRDAPRVDLNRNYGACWGGTGASTDPTNDTYRGPGPWSEPETQAVHEFSQRLQITNFHDAQRRRARAAPARASRRYGLAPDEDAPEGARRRDGRGDRLHVASTATSSTRSPARPRTGTTSRRARSATRSSSGGDRPAATSRAPTRPTSSTSTSAPTAPRTGGKGVREALLLAGEQAANPADHAVADAAPRRPGATLRLRKTFKTTTSPVCARPHSRRRQRRLPRSPRPPAATSTTGSTRRSPCPPTAVRLARQPVDAAVRAQGGPDRGVDADLRAGRPRTGRALEVVVGDRRAARHHTVRMPGGLGDRRRRARPADGVEALVRPRAATNGARPCSGAACSCASRARADCALGSSVAAFRRGRRRGPPFRGARPGARAALAPVRGGQAAVELRSKTSPAPPGAGCGAERAADRPLRPSSVARRRSAPRIAARGP